MDAERKAIKILSEGARTYRELESELNDPRLDLKGLVYRLKDAGKIKHISAGNRPVFFLRESQRMEADIKALGKNCLKVYNFLEGGGAYRSREIKERLGLQGNSFAKEVRNLVSHGYAKTVKMRDQADGDIYYVHATKEQLRLARLGKSARSVYGAIDAHGYPMFSGEIADELGITIFNASGLAKRLARRGYLYESELTGGSKGGEREKMRHSCFYTRKSQGPLANIMSLSPKYGIQVYKTLVGKGRTTVYVTRKTGIPREWAFRVLASMEAEGLARRVAGRPDKWYLTDRAPEVSFRSYAR